MKRNEEASQRVNRSTGREKKVLNSTVLVYEPRWSGHHLQWIRWIVDALRNAGKPVMIALSREAMASEEYEEYLRPIESSFSVDERSVFRRSAYEWRFSGWEEVSGILRTLRETGPAQVLFPCLSKELLPFSAGLVATRTLGLQRCSYQGVYFPGRFAYRESGNVLARCRRKLLVKMVVGSGVFENLLFLDEFALDSLGVNRGSTRIGVCPDPVNLVVTGNRRILQERFGVPESARVVASLGRQTARKGVDRLIQAFCTAGLSENTYLLVAGRADSAVRRAIEQGRESRTGQERIIFRDRLLSKEEFHGALEGCHVVAMIYPEHYQSASMLYRACAAAKPILGSRQGWIGRMLSRHSLGYACDATEVGSIREGLRWAETEWSGVDVGAAQALAARNSVGVFQEELLRVLYGRESW